jgi:hypothetical protein
VRIACLLALSLAAVFPAHAVITTDDPNNHLVTPPSLFDGVAQIIFSGGTLCSGALLSTGQHILTAAHCAQGKTDFSASFAALPGPFTGTAAEIAVHPDFVSLVNADIAVLTLASVIDAIIPRYDLYRDTGEVGSDFTFGGYGFQGTGATGQSALGLGILRTGQNTFEGDAAILSGSPFTPGSFLFYDFDNGLSAQNSFGSLGLGNNEAVNASGDSGGPAWLSLSGQLYIAGVTSWRAQTTLHDIDATNNGTFGELGGVTRVSAFQNWVDTQTGVPEPATWTLLAGGLAFAALRSRRRRP